MSRQLQLKTNAIFYLSVSEYTHVEIRSHFWDIPPVGRQTHELRDFIPI